MATVLTRPTPARQDALFRGHPKVGADRQRAEEADTAPVGGSRSASREGLFGPYGHDS